VEGEKRASLVRRVMNRRSVALGWRQSTPSRWLASSALIEDAVDLATDLREALLGVCGKTLSEDVFFPPQG